MVAAERRRSRCTPLGSPLLTARQPSSWGLAFPRVARSSNDLDNDLRNAGPTCACVTTTERNARDPYGGRVADERGGWRTYGEKTIYHNRWVRLGLVDVEAPNGARWDYHVVHFGRIAIAMIVNEDDDTVLMLWRYRFATDQWGFEHDHAPGVPAHGEGPKPRLWPFSA